MHGLPTEKFWMIYGVDAGAPTVMHKSLDLAKEEAKRLARKAHGTVFVVLEAVGAVVKDDLRTVIFQDRVPRFSDSADDEIPF